MMETNFDENQQIQAVCGLVRRFAHEVLSRQKQYQDDLLVSCLQFIISLPSECIDYDFADYVPAIQVRKRLNKKKSYRLCIFSACFDYWLNLFTIS